MFIKTIVNVHKTSIRDGDIIICNGEERVVSKDDITEDDRRNISIFGSNYDNGFELVKKVISERL